jgi:hypothetical protein
VTCLSCSAELPAGAMFCGECGRATTARIAPPPRPAPSSPARSLPAPVWPDAAQWPISAPPATPAPAPWPVAPAAVAKPPVEPTAPGDTVVLGYDFLSADFDPAPPPQVPTPPAAEPTSEPASESEPAPESEFELAPESVPDPESRPAPEPTPTLAPYIAPRTPAPASPAPATPAPASPAPATPAPASPAPASPAPALSAPGSENFDDDDLDDLERTRIVPRREHGERFVLQFSTGESVTVHGTGLLGRNPLPQPGERFDQLVVISDPGKSVSKTHLEFGQEQGAFWVSDRFSGNGSVVREPDTAQRRVEPGKRYRVVRGTRVDIGEQFFVVS